MNHTRNTISDKKAALVELLTAADELPDYTLGDLLYAVLRRLAKSRRGDIRFLRGVSDSELYCHIERAIGYEKGQ